jgi:hypothetical protein
MKTLIISSSSIKIENVNIDIEPEYLYSSLDYSLYNCVIIDSTEKEALKIIHYLSQKFLLNKLTMIYISNILNQESREKLQTVGFEEFYPDLDSALSASSVK